MQLPRANEAWYLIIFFILTIGGLILILFNEIGEVTDDSWVSTLENIEFGMGWVVIVAGAFAYTGMEGFNMLAERYARRQREEGRLEGRQEVLDILDRIPADKRSEELEAIIGDVRKSINRETTP